LICIKRNRLHFYDAIVAHCALVASLGISDTSETSHGRYERRRVAIWQVTRRDFGGFVDRWAGVRRIVRVERWRGLGARQSHSVHYYISSLTSRSAKRFAAIIRGHWQIENGLHHVRDVYLHEDRITPRDLNAAGCYATLRSILFNLMHLNGFASIKKAIISLANRIDLLAPMFLRT
jgi:hypothetical protein